MRTIKVNKGNLSRISTIKHPILIGLFYILSSNLIGQVTTEKIVTDASELTKIDLSTIRVVKYEPSISNLNLSSNDSSGTALTSQPAITTSNVTAYGFTVSDLVKVFPEAVDKDEKGDFNIDFMKMVPIMFKIIQEQNSRIKVLEDKVMELQNRIK